MLQGAILCIIGCLAAASTHYMSVAPSPAVTIKNPNSLKWHTGQQVVTDWLISARDHTGCSWRRCYRCAWIICAACQRQWIKIKTWLISYTDTLINATWKLFFSSLLSVQQFGFLWLRIIFSSFFLSEKSEIIDYIYEKMLTFVLVGKRESRIGNEDR